MRLIIMTGMRVIVFSRSNYTVFTFVLTLISHKIELNKSRYIKIMIGTTGEVMIFCKRVSLINFK